MRVFFINLRKYVLDLLSEYGMLACTPAKTPLQYKLVISNEATNDDSLLDNIIDYQKLTGKLIYLTNTRPNISYVVHCLSQFMHSLLKSHIKIAFKILRYFKSSPGLGIHVPKNSEDIVNDTLVSQKSKKQNALSKSSTEAGYRALLQLPLKTKHLKIDLHIVREEILNGVIKTVKVDFANQIADILTKGQDTMPHKVLVLEDCFEYC
ncbi:hypothetical protein Tco_1431640 [Tanacetum coccineum]